MEASGRHRERPKQYGVWPPAMRGSHNRRIGQRTIRWGSGVLSLIPSQNGSPLHPEFVCTDLFPWLGKSRADVYGDTGSVKLRGVILVGVESGGLAI